MDDDHRRGEKKRVCIFRLLFYWRSLRGPLLLWPSLRGGHHGLMIFPKLSLHALALVVVHVLALAKTNYLHVK